MENSDDGREVKELSEIYDVLKNDAKEIVADLRGGVTMWREAAAGAAASAGFIVILILTAFHYGMFGGGGLEFWAYVSGAGVLALMMGGISVVGFRKYYLLRKRYASLFSRAKKLE
jgi:hypothetical protein